MSLEIPGQGLGVDRHGNKRFWAGEDEALWCRRHHFTLGMHGVPLQAVRKLNTEDWPGFETLNQTIEMALRNDRHLSLELAMAVVVELPPGVLPPEIVCLVRALDRAGQQLNEFAMIRDLHLRHEPSQMNAAQGIGDPGRGANLLDESARAILILSYRRQRDLTLEGVVKASQLIGAGERRLRQAKVAIRIAHPGLEPAWRDVATVPFEIQPNHVLPHRLFLATQNGVDERVIITSHDACERPELSYRKSVNVHSCPPNQACGPIIL